MSAGGRVIAAAFGWGRQIGGGAAGLQRALRLVYPPQCLSCRTLVEEEHALCPACWRQAGFIAGLVCDGCGLPLPGEDDGAPAVCDDCLRLARPWTRGRAAMLYDGVARRLVLGLKHGDRLDLARAGGRWLARAAEPILLPDMLVAPVPLHWLRLARRRYNQAAVLAQALAREAGLACAPDLLVRRRRTPTQEGRSAEARFRNLDGALALHPRRAGLVQDRPVLIVDDVMTSGATLAAAAEACLAGGAALVHVAVLARVAKAP